ncbi:uncharacterized protein PSFLO_06724 [Pseudozyma flocculosa]|uniref:Secreted protein n=1 Tax=Pseudozyma flocculosa TaxID=84751 RepID=A0A5C3F9Z4_9BASI|nr:uncharacterized protein PSFLO_06724 [Pseudozyma flocculosa]
MPAAAAAAVVVVVALMVVTNRYPAAAARPACRCHVELGCADLPDCPSGRQVPPDNQQLGATRCVATPTAVSEVPR